MKTIYIIIIIIVILYFTLMTLIPKIKYNKAITILQTYSSFKKHKNKLYDVTISNEEKRIYIKIVDVPKNSCVTINSKSTWHLSYGGSNDYGKAYSNSKYLYELSSFLKWEIKDTTPYEKVILINKRTSKVLMYLNESELAEVPFVTKVYDYKIIQLQNIEKDLELLGINK